MSSKIKKLKRINNFDTDSFFGLVAALFLALIFNFYLYNAFFSFFTNYFIFQGLVVLFFVFWLLIFFMIQSGILKVIYLGFFEGLFKIYSPMKNIREFIRFISAIVFFIIFVSFHFGYYPFEQYNVSLIYQGLFYIFSFGISIGYLEYVEKFKEGVVKVPRLGEYDLEGIIVIIFVLISFGIASVFLSPYLLGIIGFGLWFIMLSRLLLEK